MKKLAATWIALWLAPASAIAVEGGNGTYLLGSRDSFMGFVPGPGTYVSLEYAHIDGQGPPNLSIGGVVVTGPKSDVDLYKVSVTHVLGGVIFGGTPAINVSQLYGSGVLDVSGVFGQYQGSLSDQGNGLTDLIVTPILGWHSGNLHTSFSVSIYAPTGLYNTTGFILSPPELEDAVNFGKNRWAFDPTFGTTYFDPQSGWEFNSAIGVTFSTRNTATDYQSAPELHFEGSILKHFPEGVALGVEGYAYTQLGEDSGSGADNLKATLDAKSLRAQVFGIGPVMSVSTEAGGVPVTLKARYFHEFGGRRRFESDVIFTTFSFSF